jgi:hypothetical protein
MVGWREPQVIVTIIAAVITSIVAPIVLNAYIHDGTSQSCPYRQHWDDSQKRCVNDIVLLPPQPSHLNFTLPPTGRIIQYDLPLMPTQCSGKVLTYCFNTPDGDPVAEFTYVPFLGPDPIQSIRILSSQFGRIITSAEVSYSLGTFNKYVMYTYEFPPTGISWGGVAIVERNSFYAIEFRLFMYQNHTQQINTMLRSLIYDPNASFPEFLSK